jgi:hypothetical protein
MLLHVGGRIESKGRLAFSSAAEYLLSPTISGGEAAILPFARLKSDKIVPHVPVDSLLYYYLIYKGIV